MKAIILSAGRGSRLLPLTTDTPKCTLSVGDHTLIEHQIERLLEHGIAPITVVVGFGAHHVEQLLARRYDPRRVVTLYNPFFQIADNLASCWMARGEMNDDVVLLNGDTLFEPALLARLLAAPAHPVTLAIDRKPHYDADDMKVSLRGARLVSVGKRLAPERIDGESIGMILFRKPGAAAFRGALERAVRRPQGLRQWYLSAVDELADSGEVWTRSMQGLSWIEVDTPADLQRARLRVATIGRPAEGTVHRVA